MLKFYGIGYIVNDCQVFMTKDGKYVLSFTLGTNDNNNITYYNCLYYSENDKLSQYIKKGRTLLLEGYIKTETYQKKNGEKQKSYKFIIKELKFLNIKNNNNNISNKITKIFNGENIDDPWRETK